MRRIILKCQMICKKLHFLPTQSIKEKEKKAALYIHQHHLKED